MNRGIVVIGVLLVGLMIATIYQQRKGVEWPWTQCKESMVTQMLSGECTPSQFSGSPMRGPLQDVPQKGASQTKTPGNEVPQTEIPQTSGYKGSWVEDM